MNTRYNVFGREGAERDGGIQVKFGVGWVGQTQVVGSGIEHCLQSAHVCSQAILRDIMTVSALVNA